MKKKLFGFLPKKIATPIIVATIGVVVWYPCAALNFLPGMIGAILIFGIGLTWSTVVIMNEILTPKS